MRPVVLALLVLAAACGVRPAAGEAGCDPIERPPVQGGQHLIGGQAPPVPYSSTPPTSGWHASGAFDIAIHGPENPLTEPEQVSVLEAGGVVVTYRDLPAEDREALIAHVRARYPGEVAVTPYDKLEPGEVAFSAWGALQRCEGLDLGTLDAFAGAHLADEVRGPGHQDG